MIDGYPAMPLHPTDNSSGVCLRDYFAALAMQAIIIANKGLENVTPQGAAELATRFADALLVKLYDDHNSGR